MLNKAIFLIALLNVVLCTLRWGAELQIDGSPSGWFCGVCGWGAALISEITRR